ncbi:hypothetical protein [Labrenzia sp. VG12]|nr:hypothetical protein [Labrenzia sp. VG12]
MSDPGRQGEIADTIVDAIPAAACDRAFHGRGLTPHERLGETKWQAAF